MAVFICAKRVGRLSLRGERIMKTIFIFAEQTTTDGKRYLLGYESDNPSTGDVVVLDVGLEKWQPK